MRKREEEFLLKKAEKSGVKIQEIQKDFAEIFLFEILRMVFKRPEAKDFDFLKREATDKKISWKDFKKKLLFYGIKIEEWSEDFIDEDTGEVVQIERFSIEPKSTR